MNDRPQTGPVYPSHKFLVNMGFMVRPSNTPGTGLYATATFGEGEVLVLGKAIRFAVRRASIQFQANNCLLPQEDWEAFGQPALSELGEKKAKPPATKRRQSLKVKTPFGSVAIPQPAETTEIDLHRTVEPSGGDQAVEFILRPPPMMNYLRGVFFLDRLLLKIHPISSEAANVDIDVHIPSGGIVVLGENWWDRSVNKTLLSQLLIGKRLLGTSVRMASVSI